MLHKQKHTLPSTFIVENNNEQQLQIHVKLRNLGNQPRKTPMWGNPKREILLASGKLYQQQNCNFQQEKYTYSTQQSHSFLPRNLCQIHIVVWHSFVGQHLEKHTKQQFYRQNYKAPSTARNTPNNLDLCAHNMPRKTCPLPWCTDCTNPYNTPSLTAINFSHF